MNPSILSFDLGTGGNKASLYDSNGACLANTFVSYDTFYPQVGWHEQRPLDWWHAVVESTRQLLSKTKVDPQSIAALAISGHSLGAVPMDKAGNLLRESTPIWSDMRAQKQAAAFFSHVDPDEWYLTTGNGFPAPLYTVFKAMWYRDNEPKMWEQVYKLLGTKDFINFKLTGKYFIDYSYASGTGIYNLQKWQYESRFIKASGIPARVWPEIVSSTQVIATLLPEVAAEMGLSQNTRVVCGGVDNSCMALGAKNIKEGRVYCSLGSAAWIAVSSETPVLDKKQKPFVFAHVIPGMFTSAVSIFAAGTTYTWLKDNLCSHLAAQAARTGADVYQLMNEEAQKSPIGANKLIFNPSLAGGTSQDSTPHLRGAFFGLDLKHTLPDLIRAVMEGIVLNLRVRLDLLRKYTPTENEILFVGGGAKSRFYLGLFADVFNTSILKSNIDQDAGALGAAALAAVGCGIWEDFSRIDQIHVIQERVEPDPGRHAAYQKLLPVFRKATTALGPISDSLFQLDL
jgi:xylulokinase